MATLPACKYGSGCYRNNPKHYDEYSHPCPCRPPSNCTCPPPVHNNPPLDPVERKKDLIHGYNGEPKNDAFQTPCPNMFREGDYGDGREPKTLVERGMVRWSGEIRRKPEWWRKVNDDAIVAKWREEIKAQSPDMTEREVDFVFADLKHLATLSSGEVRVSPVFGVYESDRLIPGELKTALCSVTSSLENVLEREKDWHPGSDQQVLDLVHPSLYCLVHGVTSVTDGSPLAWSKFVGTGAPSSCAADNSPAKKKARSLGMGDGKFESKKFQWLPSEFHVDDNGTVAIESYINNLNPRLFAPGYAAIEKIFGRFLPLFRKVLSDLHSINFERRKHFIQESFNDWNPDDINDCEQPSDVDSDEDEDYRDTESGVRKLKRPQPPATYTPPEQNKINLPLRNVHLQVIVKLANIHLTPEKPDYPGGVWHVEGMKNESIVSTGIYYYDVENVSESKLSFRESICELEDYAQNDDYGVNKIYGIGREDPLNEHIGHIVAEEGRCIAFPNIYQHKVEPFTLIDKTKPGRRKILVFFLVDPAVRVTSTASVPPQQAAWVGHEVRVMDALIGLPEEIKQLILSDDNLGWPMSLSDAKKYREDLMTERKYVTDTSNETMFEREFSLCEH